MRVAVVEVVDVEKDSEREAEGDDSSCAMEFPRGRREVTWKEMGWGGRVEVGMGVKRAEGEGDWRPEEEAREGESGRTCRKALRLNDASSAVSALVADFTVLLRSLLEDQLNNDFFCGFDKGEAVTFWRGAICGRKERCSGSA